MAEAKRDQNAVTTLLAVSNADGVTPVVLYANPTTHRLLVSSAPGALDDLTDVVITSGAQGDVLYFNGTDWVNLAAGTSGHFLKTQGAGANPVWAAATSVPAGSDTQVQFNDGGALAGDSGMVFNKTTNVLTLLGAVQASTANIADTDVSHFLVLTAGSDLTANRALTFTTGDSARTITLSGNPTLADWFDQAVKTSSSPQFSTVELGAASDTTIARAAAGRLTVEAVAIMRGPGSATDNTLPRFDGTTGDLLQTSGVVVDDSNNVSGVAILTTTGDIELGHASDTTLARVSAGVVSIEGVNIVTVSATQTLTNKTLTAPVINAGTIGTSLVPTSDDGAALGDTTHNFSDLFLASGAVVNYANGNVVLTHSSGILTMGTGELRVTTPGTNSASVPTLGSTSTLTNKTLTSPVIAASTMSGIHQLTETGEIRLDAASSADGAYNGITRAGTAGATLAFGDLVYLAAADSRWELADADAASTSGDVLLGMCILAAAADGDPTVLLLYGIIRADAAFPSLTIGAPAYVSTTAGDIQTSQPSGTDDVIRRVGFAWTADELLFNPSNDYVTHT